MIAGWAFIFAPLKEQFEIKHSLRQIHTLLSIANNSTSTKSFQALLSSTPNKMKNDDYIQEKSAFRLEAKQRLATISVDEKSRQSEIVKEKLLANDLYKNAKTVSIFLSISDEIQTIPIVKHMLETDKIVFIPRYSTGENCQMDMVRLYSWEDYEKMPTTRWNIKQPSLSEQRESASESGGLDLVIMPGLAFTKEGHRLGRGKGHYDRFLYNYAHNHQVKPHTIALAFKEQILLNIPTTERDYRVEKVIFDD